MNPISPIQSQSCGATANLSQMANSLRGGEVGPGASMQTSAQSAAATNITSMVATISQSFSQSMQSSGGSAATEQLMRTLIAAIILLALLDQTQRGSDSMEGVANLLTAGGLAGSRQSEMYSSFSFVSYEQTSVSMSYSASADYAPQSPNGGSAQGGQLDVSG